MPWITHDWGQPLTRGGNLLVQNACLDHFRDGLSDGRTPQPFNQLTINHFIINHQPISHRAATAQSASEHSSVSGSNPSVVEATELATAHSITQQSLSKQSVISHSAINQSSVISEHGSSPLAGLHSRLVVCSAARRPSNTFINNHCIITQFSSHAPVRALRCRGLLSTMISTDAQI